LRTLVAIWLVLSVMLLGGCAAKKTVAIHPRAISNLDSYTYDILLVEQDAINAARASYASGQLPEQAKPYLAKAIDQYNVTQGAWHAYHDQHAGNESALQDALNALIGAVAQLEQVLGKAPAPVPAAPTSWLLPQEVPTCQLT
jgi:hypothetical protein